MNKLSKLLVLFLFLMVISGCINSEVTSNSSDDDMNKISELEKQMEELESQNQELESKLKHYSVEKEAFPSINMKVSAFMRAITNTDMDTIVALSEKNMPLFMKDSDIWTTYSDIDLNLTHNAMNETLVSWFIESIELNPDTNEMDVLVRPHYVDANNETVQEVDRYYQLIFTKANDEWLISKIIK